MKSHRAKLGQNFLADGGVLRRIIEVAEIEPSDIVLEIGPGQGSLTYALCQKAKKVIAVEKDEKLFEYLQRKFSKVENLELVNGDILQYLKITKLQNYKIISNIPYYLTSFLLRTISGMENKPSEMTFMVQKEVAERMCAQPPQMNLLALSVQMFAVAEIKFFVSKKSFHPAPKVDSAVIKLEIKKLRNYEIKDQTTFFNLIKQGFSSKRKTLANNLTGYENLTKDKIFVILGKMGMDEKIRSQELNLENWENIYEKIRAKK
ncbi:ribosomal RNA small subunit methyltransferase A [Candidatus Microgenomates bacterium]|nr:ribosomal RNA small subunit methyltransferase A [Candidatus Microgenomates bacterium]